MRLFYISLIMIILLMLLAGGSYQTTTGKAGNYKENVLELYNKTGKWIAMIGLDYEHDKIFSPAELSEANTEPLTTENMLNGFRRIFPGLPTGFAGTTGPGVMAVIHIIH